MSLTVLVFSTTYKTRVAPEKPVSMDLIEPENEARA